MTLSRNWLILRAMLILLACGGLLWVALASTFATIARNHNAELALRWWPFDAEARSLAAYRLATGQRPTSDDLARARMLSEAALRRDPTNVTGARTLGVIAALQGDERGARQWLEHAQSLSRRDIPTQLLLLESEVQRNNIEGALRHYDRALRVSTGTRDMLLPILVEASADPAIARPLGAFLAGRPLWRTAFGEALAERGENPRTLVFLLGALGLDMSDERERAIVIAGLRRLVAAGAYDEAARLYRRTAGAARVSQLLRNGDFESGDEGLAPFDWVFVNEPGLGSFREGRENASGQFALSLLAESGRSGEVARQLLLLAPGSYTFRALAGDIPEDRHAIPSIVISCVGESPREVMRAAPSPAPSSASRFESRFTIPANCPAQWLSVRIGTAQSRGGPPWIDAIVIQAAN